MVFSFLKINKRLLNQNDVIRRDNARLLENIFNMIVINKPENHIHYDVPEPPAGMDVLEDLNEDLGRRTDAQEYEIENMRG